MSAIANIAINDGASTPVTHTFTPNSTNPATYRNGNAASSSGGLVYDETIKIGVKVEPNGISKVAIQMRLPYDTSALSAEKPVMFEQVNIEFLIPGTSNSARRKDLRVLASNLLLNSQVVDSVDNLSGPY